VTWEDASSYSFRQNLGKAMIPFGWFNFFPASAGLMLTVKMVIPMNLELLHLLLLVIQVIVQV